MEDTCTKVNQRSLGLENSTHFRNMLLVISMLYVFIVACAVLFSGQKYFEALGWIWFYSIVSVALSFVAIPFPKFSTSILVSFSLYLSALGLNNSYYSSSNMNDHVSIIVFAIFSSYVWLIGLVAFFTLYKSPLVNDLKEINNEVQGDKIINTRKLRRRARRRGYIRSRLSTALKTPKYRG